MFIGFVGNNYDEALMKPFSGSRYRKRMETISSKNIAFMSNAKNAVSNPLLIAYGNKSVELRVMKNVMTMYQDSFLEKERILEEEKRKLEELHYRVWSLEDSFCEQVWQFSYEHDFSVIFKYHPFLMEMSHCTKQRNNNKNDMEKSPELIDLINEIDIIRTEISNLNYTKDVKREVENALMNFRKLQLISDDITELLRLISSSESSCKLAIISIPIYEEIISNNGNKIRRRKNDSSYENWKNKKAHQKESSVKNKSCLKNDKLNAISNKKTVFVTPNNYPQLSLERSVIFTEKTTIMNTSRASTSSEKLKSFTLKKRSKTSIRFEQHREGISNN